MEDTIVTRVDRQERIGPYGVCVSGNAAYVCIQLDVFLRAAFSGKIEEVLRDAFQATRKYESYDRILLLTLDQIEVARHVPFPFEQAGFQRVHGLMSETTPLSDKAVAGDLG